MQRHSSWNKEAPSELFGLSRVRRHYTEDGKLTLLRLVDRGHETTDQFLVKFQGKTVYFSMHFEEAAKVYDKLEEENF